MAVKGTYQYKCVAGSNGWTATAMGEMAEGLPECSGADAYAVNKAIFDAVKAKAETEDFTFCNDMVTPKVSLWTACIGTAKAGAAVAAPAAGAAAAGGGGGAAAAAAKAPEPEPEEEEEDMGFDLFD